MVEKIEPPRNERLVLGVRNLDYREIRDGVATAAVWLSAGAVLVALTWILIDIVTRGWSQLHWEFLTAGVEHAGRAGGIGPLILSTLLILMVTLAVATPISAATAIALTEGREGDRGFARWFARCVGGCLDVLAGVPSIVFGLFGNAFFSIALGMGYSILAGGLTLACMVLPLLTRSFEQSLGAVPHEYRQGAAALGLGRVSTLFRVTAPAAMPALLAAVVLSIGRALAETAALIFTAGYVARAPQSLWDSGRSLSVHIYDLAMNVPGGSARAYATACVLVLMLLAINAVVGLLLHATGFRSER